MSNTLAQPEPTSRLRRLLRHMSGSPRECDNNRCDTRLMTPSPEIRVSAHGDGLIILHIPSGRIFTCNATGCRIWNRVVGGAAPDTVSGEISRDFGVAPELARQHTYAFVHKLQHEGLLIRA